MRVALSRMYAPSVLMFLLPAATGACTVGGCGGGIGGLSGSLSQPPDACGFEGSRRCSSTKNTSAPNATRALLRSFFFIVPPCLYRLIESCVYLPKCVNLIQNQSFFFSFLFFSLRLHSYTFAIPKNMFWKTFL